MHARANPALTIRRCWVGLYPLLLVSLLGACGRNDPTALYPLAVGQWWYYRSQTQILDETRDERILVGNVGAGEQGGERVVVQHRVPNQDNYLSYTSDGLIRMGVRFRGQSRVKFGEGPAKILPASTDPGTRWALHSQLALIESRTFARQDKLRNRYLPFELAMNIVAIDETIDVPAGRYENCVRVEGTAELTVRVDRGNATANVRVLQHDWYAPGVGLVKSARQESSDSPFLKTGTYEQELLAFGG